MRRIICIITLGLLLTVGAAPVMAGSSNQSSSWSTLVHEENSIVASILYLPYMAAIIPIRIIDGIINPTPASMATIPPAAHSSGH
jgi:hypothetical protein